MQKIGQHGTQLSLIAFLCLDPNFHQHGTKIWKIIIGINVSCQYERQVTFLKIQA